MTTHRTSAATRTRPSPGAGRPRLRVEVGGHRGGAVGHLLGERLAVADASGSELGLGGLRRRHPVDHSGGVFGGEAAAPEAPARQLPSTASTTTAATPRRPRPHRPGWRPRAHLAGGPGDASSRGGRRGHRGPAGGRRRRGGRRRKWPVRTTPRPRRWPGPAKPRRSLCGKGWPAAPRRGPDADGPGRGRAMLARGGRPPPALLDALEPIVVRLEREIRSRARPDPRVEALQQLPGVGLLTAMNLVAEIGDIRRFESARRLCSWSGLTPRVRNSDTQGPPRPHHQDGPGGALRAGRGGPRAQDQAALRRCV